MSALKPVLLVLDDEPDIASSIQALLEAAFGGVDVIAVTTAKEARECLKTRRVDALVLDYRLGGETGIDFLEKVREAKPDLPAIFITAYPDPQVLMRAVNKGRVEGLFIKPLNPHDLVEAVERVLRKRAGGAGRIPFNPLFGRGPG